MLDANHSNPDHALTIASDGGSGSGAAAALPDRHLRYLSREDVLRIGVTIQEAAEVVREALRDRGRGLALSAPKAEIESAPGDTLRAMMAWSPRHATSGVKWIAAVPGNAALGHPIISGLQILNDGITGLPRTILDCTWLTALRTAACTAVTASLFARPDATSLGLIACGLQGKMNAEALIPQHDLRTVRLFDINPAAAEALAAHLTEKFAVQTTVVEHPRDALHDVDLAVTSRPIAKQPLDPIRRLPMKPGALFCLLDFDASWPGSSIAKADRFLTDDREQFRHLRHLGYLRRTPAPSADLGQVLAGAACARTSAEERVVVLNAGMSLLDLALGVEIERRASSTGVGSILSL